MAQVERGWLGSPDRVTDRGRVERAPAEAINLAFRFGVSQQNKLRARDDVRRSGTNADCLIRTPNILPTWDHLAQLALRGAPAQPNWSFFKEDHASAYKWLPLLQITRGSRQPPFAHPLTASGTASPPPEPYYSAQQHPYCAIRALAGP